MTEAIQAQLPISKRRVTGSGLALVAATLVALLSLVPLGFILVVALTSGWDEVARLVIRPKVGELLLNSFWLELLTVPLCVLLGVTLAWLTERTRLPGAGIWAGLMVAPLGVPAFVQSYAWSSAFPSFHGLAGAVTIAIVAYFPFVYLPVAAQLRRLDPALEDNAASLGLRPAAVFFRVVLPQLRLSICAGGLLVGLHLLGEYGLFVLMRYDTFATAIVDQFQAVYDGPAANLLGGVLVLCCLVLLGGEALLRGDRRYARVGSGSARMATPVALGKWMFPTLLLLSLVVVAALGVTLVTLGRWLWYGGLAAWQLDPIVAALGQTLLYALLAGLVATAMAMPMAWISVRAPGRWQRILEASHLYVGALPGIIIALALVAITVRVALPLYQTVATLIIAYALIFLPRALTGLRSSIAQVPVELERAAMNLGRPPVVAVWQVTMRLASPGIVAAILLVALGAANELTATLMLAPNGTRTLATKFWALTSEVDYAGAAPYALLLILVSMPLTLLLRRQSNRAIGQ